MDLTRIKTFLVVAKKQAWLIIGPILLVGFLAGIYYVESLMLGASTIFPKEASGKIVDKRIDFSDSRYGSHASRCLILKTTDGQSEEIPVSQKIFDEAQIGMKIQSGRKGVSVVPNE